MRTDLVYWCKDLGSLPEGVWDALTAEAKAVRRKIGGKPKMLRENRSEVIEVKVRGRFYYAHVFGMGWTLLKVKEAK